METRGLPSPRHGRTSQLAWAFACRDRPSKAPNLGEGALLLHQLHHVLVLLLHLRHLLQRRLHGLPHLVELLLQARLPSTLHSARAGARAAVATASGGQEMLCLASHGPSAYLGPLLRLHKAGVELRPQGRSARGRLGPRLLHGPMLPLLRHRQLCPHHDVLMGRPGSNRSPKQMRGQPASKSTSMVIKCPRNAHSGRRAGQDAVAGTAREPHLTAGRRPALARTRP